MTEIDWNVYNRLHPEGPDPDEGWHAMDESVAALMIEAGPKGYIEFHPDGDKWRMHYADGRVVV